MVGPKNTPYEGGLFTLLAIFPDNYPIKGPEIKFINKIYHLNVDFKYYLGHICVANLNSWWISGKVKDYPYYTMKQALKEHLMMKLQNYIFIIEINTKSMQENGLNYMHLFFKIYKIYINYLIHPINIKLNLSF